MNRFLNFSFNCWCWIIITILLQSRFFDRIFRFLNFKFVWLNRIFFCDIHILKLLSICVWFIYFKLDIFCLLTLIILIIFSLSLRLFIKRNIFFWSWLLNYRFYWITFWRFCICWTLLKWICRILFIYFSISCIIILIIVIIICISSLLLLFNTYIF